MTHSLVATAARATRQHGFSLIEAVCALVVLAVGVVGVAEGITTALRSSKESEVQSIAAFLAAGRIELLRADGFITAGDDEGTFQAPFEAYRWRESVTETDPEGLYEVVVAIERDGEEKRLLELRTLLFDAPLDLSTGSAAGTGSSPAGRRRRGGVR